MKYKLIRFCVAASVLYPLYFWAESLIGGMNWAFYLHEAGRASALAAVPLLAAQYALTSRSLILERGAGLDRLTSLHRGVGLVACSMLVAHPLLMITAERIQGYTSPFGPAKLIGAAALTFALAAAATASLHARFSFLTYERWKTIHLVAYAVIPLAIVHAFSLGYISRQPAMRALWALAAGLYLIFVFHRLRRWFHTKRTTHNVTSVERETPDTWTIHVGGSQHPYLPGQFMFVQLYRHSKLSSQHPFTISSTPTRPGLSFTVKEAGDFTGGIRETRPGSPVYLEGPFGTFSILDHPADAYVFIAGGIGVTPFISMIRYLADTDSTKAVTLIWANKTERDIAFRQELQKTEASMPRLRIIHVLSRDPSWPGEKGRITTDLISRHTYESGLVDYFICGPEGMMDTASSCLSELGVPKGRIHSERFRLP